MATNHSSVFGYRTAKVFCGGTLDFPMQQAMSLRKLYSLVFLLKLKDELYHESFTDGITFLAHEYLDKALQKLEEYRY